MVGVMPDDPDFALTWQIMELERHLGKLNWWQFIAKFKAKQKLGALRILAFHYGLERAMVELEKAGIVKRVKN